MDLDRILEHLKPGLKLKLSIGEKEFLDVITEEDRIEVRILDMELLKDRLPKSKSKTGIGSLADAAKSLEDRGYTLDVLNGDKLLLRVGRDARPGLLTFFGPVQVVDLRAVLKLLG
ncbi:MAG: hypothetical protein V3T58_04815 [Candidatus Hydrothermarchaeales archaeon]